MRSPEESRARAVEIRAEKYAFAAYIFCVTWFLAGFIVLGYQVYHWLKTASWIELPLYVVFEWLEIDLSFISNMKWQGIKAIFIWILESPLSLMLFVFGGLISWAFIAIADSK